MTMGSDIRKIPLNPYDKLRKNIEFLHRNVKVVEKTCKFAFLRKITKFYDFQQNLESLNYQYYDLYENPASKSKRQFYNYSTNNKVESYEKHVIFLAKI